MTDQEKQEKLRMFEEDVRANLEALEPVEALRSIALCAMLLAQELE